jgi:hypothetical protein
VNRLSLVGCGVISAACVLPLAAEPMSFDQLSVHGDKEAVTATSQVRWGKSSGTNKYAPYRDRFTDSSADTEIAVFEEHKGTEREYQKPVRSDRIPSM